MRLRTIRQEPWATKGRGRGGSLARSVILYFNHTPSRPNPIAIPSRLLTNHNTYGDYITVRPAVLASRGSIVNVYVSWSIFNAFDFSSFCSRTFINHLLSYGPFQPCLHQTIRSQALFSLDGGLICYKALMCNLLHSRPGINQEECQTFTL